MDRFLSTLTVEIVAFTAEKDPICKFINSLKVLYNFLTSPEHHVLNTKKSMLALILKYQYKCNFKCYSRLVSAISGVKILDLVFIFSCSVRIIL